MTWTDAVKNAVSRAQRGERDDYWAWHLVPQLEREAMDKFLVEIKHPLAYQPGTQEYRFKMLVTEHLQ